MKLLRRAEGETQTIPLGNANERGRELNNGKLTSITSLYEQAAA